MSVPARIDGGRPPAAVVLGGSAGSLDALAALLADLPDELALPLAVVVHVPRRQPSRLAKALGGRCARPVREAQDKEPLGPGVVYVAPPDYHLLIEPGPAFALSLDGPVNFSQPSIDVLFESAADALGPEVIGVIFSGANADGARGLRAIVQAGGQALVQRPEEAPCPTMPQAALSLCPGARALAAREMPGALLALAGGPGAAR